MSAPDLINASFEVLGGVFTLAHCRTLWRDKMVKGVSVAASMCFLTWGFWNLYYYPHLEQWLSFYGGLGLVATNVLYIMMLLYYKKYPGGKTPTTILRPQL